MEDKLENEQEDPLGFHQKSWKLKISTAGWTLWTRSMEGTLDNLVIENSAIVKWKKLETAWKFSKGDWFKQTKN